MHHVYEDIFQNTSAINAKIIVGNRYRRDVKNELIRKQPPKRLLKNTQIKSKLVTRLVLILNEKFL